MPRASSLPATAPGRSSGRCATPIAYWFTASTSFANPAVTVARSLSDSFAGIAPQLLPHFVLGQLAGTFAALAMFGWVLKEEQSG